MKKSKGKTETEALGEEKKKKKIELEESDISTKMARGVGHARIMSCLEANSWRKSSGNLWGEVDNLQLFFLVGNCISIIN